MPFFQIQIGLHESVPNTVHLQSVNDTFIVPIVAGEAYFDGIYISKAGIPCTLVFTTNLTLEGGTSCTSSTFTVHAGLPSFLEIVEDVPDTVPAGTPFATQPKVQLMDAGGNVCSNENLLTLRVSIGHNPAGANLIPASNTIANIYHGVAQFKHLFIDLANKGYFLCFHLMKQDGIANYNETKIVTCGKFRLLL